MNAKQGNTPILEEVKLNGNVPLDWTRNKPHFTCIKQKIYLLRNMSTRHNRVLPPKNSTLEKDKQSEMNRTHFNN